MRTWLKALIAVVCSAYALMAHADFQSDLLKRFPSAQGAKVARAFPGFWSVVKGEEIFFVNDDLSILISGNVFDLKNHRSLSDDIRDASRPKLDVKQLDLRDAIKLGSGSRKLYVFDDPDCPFCRRLEGALDQLHDVTIYIFPFPLTELHPNAAGVAEAIWCQRDRAQAWREYQKLAQDTIPHPTPAVIGGSGVAAQPPAPTLSLMDAWHDYLHANGQPDQPTCDNPIARNLALGKTWNIQGTPALIFQDGTLIPGSVSVGRIEAQLQQSSGALVGANK